MYVSGTDTNSCSYAHTHPFWAMGFLYKDDREKELLLGVGPGFYFLFSSWILLSTHSPIALPETWPASIAAR